MREGPRAEVLDEWTLLQIEQVLRAACGLTLASSLRRSLGEALERAARAQGMPREAFLERVLARDVAAVEVFIGYAVVGETYFFRHPEHLRELGRVAAASAEPFRVWSAGCASGEEPYSIAMMLLVSGVPAERVRVLGTDVSGRALERARAARYGAWSVRRMEPELERRLPAHREGGVTVPPEARRVVEFQRHNLLTDEPPVRDVQAVFCRNVLIYFPPEVLHGVLSRLVDALAPGGRLFLSPAEAAFARGMGLEEEDVEGSLVLRLPLEGRRVPVARKAASLQLVPLPAAPPPPLPRVELAPAPLPPAAPIHPARLEVLEQARAAVQAGRYEAAEELARTAARELSPEAYLLLAMLAEVRGDVQGAVAAVRKALYLEPTLAVAHAMLVTLYNQLGQCKESERSRQNALRALEGLDDEHELRGVEVMTVGGLRRALAPGAPLGKSGAR